MKPHEYHEIQPDIINLMLRYDFDISTKESKTSEYRIIDFFQPSARCRKPLFTICVKDEAHDLMKQFKKRRENFEENDLKTLSKLLKKLLK